MASDDDTINEANLTPQELFFAGLLMVWVSFVSWLLNLGIEWANGIAGLRCCIQIVILAYFVLEPLFDAKTYNWILVYLAAVVLLAARESMNRLSFTYVGIRAHYVLAIFAGAASVLTYTVILVLELTPWWEAQYMIPTAGMILGNQVTATALVVEAYLRDLHDAPDRVDLRLQRGASIIEAAMPTIRSSLYTALTPSFNMMTVMGLVSMPGMMSGQMMAGQSPLNAGLYQVMIMYLLMTASFIACVVLLIMSTITIFDPVEQYLRIDKIIRLHRKGPRRDIITSFIYSILDWTEWCVSTTRNTTQNCLNYCDASTNCPATYARLVPLNENDENYCIPTVDSVSGLVIISGNSMSDVEKGMNEIPIEKPRSFVCISDDAAGVQRRNAGKAVIFQAVDLVIAQTGLKVNLAAAKGEVTVITGVTGAGKSTTMRVLARTARRLSGEMYLEDVPASKISGPTWRTRVIYVSQDRPTIPGSPKDLYDALRAYRAQVARAKKYAAQVYSLRDHDDESTQLYPDDAPTKIAEQWGLDPAKFHQPWNTLSGGEAQRASLSIALALKPEVLLLDEPTSALDVKTTLKVEKNILATGAAVILVTHSQEQAKRLASNRVQILDADLGDDHAIISAKK